MLPAGISVIYSSLIHSFYRMNSAVYIVKGMFNFGPKGLFYVLISRNLDVEGRESVVFDIVSTEVEITAGHNNE